MRRGPTALGLSTATGWFSLVPLRKCLVPGAATIEPLPLPLPLPLPPPAPAPPTPLGLKSGVEANCLTR